MRKILHLIEAGDWIQTTMQHKTLTRTTNEKGEKNGAKIFKKVKEVKWESNNTSGCLRYQSTDLPSNLDPIHQIATARQ